MIRAGTAILAMAVLCAPAFAATCTVSSGGVAFGAYNSLGHRSYDTIGQVTVSCSGAQGETVSFTLSLTTISVRSTGRRLRGGKQSLQYDLYLDPGRTHVWGDGTAGTSAIKGSIVLSNGHGSQNCTVYGRMPGGQNDAGSGAYTDAAVLNLVW
jgi:spore coat protein U-like protein